MIIETDPEPDWYKKYKQLSWVDEVELMHYGIDFSCMLAETAYTEFCDGMFYELGSLRTPVLPSTMPLELKGIAV